MSQVTYNILLGGVGNHFFAQSTLPKTMPKICRQSQGGLGGGGGGLKYKKKMMGASVYNLVQLGVFKSKMNTAISNYHGTFEVNNLK